MRQIKRFFLRFKRAFIVLPVLIVLGVVAFFVVSDWSKVNHRDTVPTAVGQSGAQEPEIAYLVLAPNGESGDIWRIGAGGGKPVQITASGGKVRDYAVSKDGKYLVFSLDNAQNGDDLWVIGRDGSGERLLVDCGKEQCEQARWSIDGKKIAYSRMNLGGVVDAGGASRVWLVDAASGQTVPLYQDATIQGSDPSWSPDGKRIAVFDSNAHSIRVLDLETQKEILLPTGLGEVGGWSPDGQQMIYNDIQSPAGLPSVIVYLADLNNNKVIPLLGQDMKGEDFGIANWSPDGSWIAIGVGNTSGAGGKQLEIMKPDGSSPKQLTTDLSFAQATYHWNATGSELVYQRLKMTQVNNGPQIMIWQASTGESQVLVDRGAMPEWMP